MRNQHIWYSIIVIHILLKPCRVQNTNSFLLNFANINVMFPENLPKRARLEGQWSTERCSSSTSCRGRRTQHQWLQVNGRERMEGLSGKHEQLSHLALMIWISYRRIDFEELHVQIATILFSKFRTTCGLKLEPSFHTYLRQKLILLGSCGDWVDGDRCGHVSLHTWNLRLPALSLSLAVWKGFVDFLG